MQEEYIKFIAMIEKIVKNILDQIKNRRSFIKVDVIPVPQKIASTLLLIHEERSPGQRNISLALKTFFSTDCYKGPPPACLAALTKKNNKEILERIFADCICFDLQWILTASILY